MDLPRDLTTLTPEQTAEAIAYLMRLPLKELRRRQAITREQLTVAHDTQHSAALANLTVMENHLARAVLAQCFN